MSRLHSRSGNGRGQRSWLFLAIAVGLLVAAAPAQAAPFAYVTNFVDSTISQYKVGAGGRLAPLSPPTAAAPAAPLRVAVSPNGRSIYVTNPRANSISQYDIGAGGKLSPKTPPTVPVDTPAGLAVSPDGRSVYVATDESNRTVSQFDVGAGGRLSPKSPATAPAIFDTLGVAVSPDGRSAYVTNFEPSAISQYDVGAGGRLSLKSPESVGAAYDPTEITVSPDGRSVYVLATGGTPSNHFFGIRQYDVGAGGRLSPKSPPAIASPPGVSPGDIVVSPDGRSVYVTNGTFFGEASTIAQYDVDASGRLSPKSPPTVSAPRGAGRLTVRPNGRSLYETIIPGCCRPGSVAQYDVGPGGRLSPKSRPKVPAGREPNDIAVTPPTPGWEGFVNNPASGCKARVQAPYVDGNQQVVAYTEVVCPRPTQLTIRSRLRSDYPSADVTVDQKGCIKGCTFTVPKGERFFRLACPKSPNRRHHQRYYSDILLYPDTDADAATKERSRGKFLSPFCAS